MNTLTVSRLSKRFSALSRPAVSDVTFELQPDEILALVGPSGCGKTTILRLIAGLERPDGGSIHLNGREVAGPSAFVRPEQRGVGMVFQDHALFPHLSVYANVAFGLRGRDRETVRRKVDEMLDLVGLAGLAQRYPHALSGGERQRVALARALAPGPALILLDEPFSSLDADLRLAMREQVREILKSMHATALFVTHDQEEAIYMGDRMAVVQAGRIEQIGAPEEVFHRSQTRFVAEFMGNSDFLSGWITSEGVQTEIGLLPQAVDWPSGSPVEVAVRADDVDFELSGEGSAQIAACHFRGAFNLYRLQLRSGEVVHALKPHTYQAAPGERIRAYVSAGHPLAIFPKTIV